MPDEAEVLLIYWQFSSTSMAKLWSPFSYVSESCIHLDYLNHIQIK